MRGNCRLIGFNPASLEVHFEGSSSKGTPSTEQTLGHKTQLFRTSEIPTSNRL